MQKLAMLGEPPFRPMSDSVTPDSGKRWVPLQGLVAGNAKGQGSLWMERSGGRGHADLQCGRPLCRAEACGGNSARVIMVRGTHLGPATDHGFQE